MTIWYTLITLLNVKVLEFGHYGNEYAPLHMWQQECLNHQERAPRTFEQCNLWPHCICSNSYISKSRRKISLYLKYAKTNLGQAWKIHYFLSFPMFEIWIPRMRRAFDRLLPIFPPWVFIRWYFGHLRTNGRHSNDFPIPWFPEMH